MLESFNLGEFKYKRLTEEEQQSRKILGRLVGVIADTNNATRNGRKYGLDLWQKVFDDPVMKEKIANRCVFSELGHPTDREEIDMSKVCACLAEQPKLGDDGKLYGVFDILDLPNGKILKTLCDYGTTIGVSSRGSGDIMDNNEVDPDTYYCECFDIVVVPAVKEARLQFMNESLDTKAAKLKASLTESYNAASEEDKKIMKETLDNLNLSIDPEVELEEPEIVDLDGVVFGDELPAKNIIVEEDTEETPEEEIEEISEDELEVEDSEDNENTETHSPAETVGDFIDLFKDYDKDLDIEFKPIVINGIEYPVETVEVDDSEDDKIVITFDYGQEIGDDKEEVEEKPEEVSDEEVEETEEAEDDGAEEVIESLKEMVRQKDDLESEVKSLRNEKAVNDVEVESLKEELNKYKMAFDRTSTIAAKAKVLNGNIKQLKEQLIQKDVQIDKLKNEQNNKLTEGLVKSDAKVRKLTEQLSSKNNELEETKQKLTEQVNIYKEKVNERTKLATSYKNKCVKLTEKYISFRASMLGVKPAEITNKLNENYSIDDIDNVCESILTESVNMSKLPYSFGKESRIKITEQKSVNRNSNYGYDIDDSLLELAGLK